MLDVINLALPFFGLIFLGLVCGKLKLGIPETGLAWMGFFLIYLALPCLFYRVLALTPLEELSNPRFILSTVLATATAFALAVVHPTAGNIGGIDPASRRRTRFRRCTPAMPSPCLVERREHLVRRAVRLGDPARRDEIRRSGRLEWDVSQRFAYRVVPAPPER